MNRTIKRTITTAGNVVLATFRRWNSDGPRSVSTCISCAAGVAVALLVSAVAHAQQLGESFRDCPQCPEMVMIPAGEFMAGSPDSEAGRDEDEGPRHKVTILRPFAVGKYEVTNEEYATYVQANPVLRSPKTHGDDKHPVTHVNWHEAKAYVAWLSRKTGHEYRLLSESEWEYAARAGTQTAYHWGDYGAANAHCDSCGTLWDYNAGFSDHEGSVQVGKFAANNFGLHDMHGNVWEWVEDCHNDSYNGAPSDGQAWLSGDCDKRVLRGGSWADHPKKLRAAYRKAVTSVVRNSFYGFRVARTN